MTKRINYVHRDYNHKHDYVVVVDTVEVKASLLDWLLRRKTEWRYEDEQIKEYWEGKYENS